MAAAAFNTGVQAGPLEELRSLSLFPAADLAQLKAGEILSERGPLGDFSRGIYLEACYYINAPMDAVGQGLLHWNPVQHRDRDVRLYQEYALPGTAAVFKKLQLSAGFAGDDWLLEQTARTAQTGAAGDLHLTSEELALLGQKPMPPSEAWQEILQRRSAALARGGLAAVPPYGSDKSISPNSEFRGLLSLAPKAARHFQPMIEAQPLVAAGKQASETVAYWEATQVRDHTTLQLGLFAARKSSESWQLVDCAYYPSDTYFMALDFFQLWPVDGGTLVWQAGFVSAPFRSYLGGVDRYIAGKQMTDETLSTIKTFRSALEKR
ncbi:MAG: hypothetical protein H0W66_00075 [Chthoniobacterales bacterium]|nr:hypothetical protein [Chthoniobacterales bacterium]